MIKSFFCASSVFPVSINVSPFATEEEPAFEAVEEPVFEAPKAAPTAKIETAEEFAAQYDDIFKSISFNKINVLLFKGSLSLKIGFLFLRVFMLKNMCKRNVDNSLSFQHQKQKYTIPLWSF